MRDDKPRQFEFALPAPSPEDAQRDKLAAAVELLNATNDPDERAAARFAEHGKGAAMNATLSPVCEIVRLHGEIRAVFHAAARTSLAHAIRIGELLVQEKAKLDHGQWLPWLKGNVPFSDRTARNYVRLFEQRDRLKLESVSDLSAAYRLLTDSDRPDDLIRELPDAETLAGDMRFETYLVAITECIDRGMERIQAIDSQAADKRPEVTELKREADRLLKYLEELTLWCERGLGERLIEMEAQP